MPGQPLQPVFITLDPYRDSCGQVGAYVADFHPRMLGLTGTPAQVAKVAKKFRVYFAEVDHAEEDDDYLGEWGAAGVGDVGGAGASGDSPLPRCAAPAG